MKFSVVTPTYNRADYVAQTIESVLSQKGDFEIEYIVMDGGSMDDTLSVIQAYQEKIENGQYPIQCRAVTMKVMSEKDHGSCDAYAKGFALTTGDIFSGLGSDDILLPGALATMHEVFTTHSNIAWVRGRHALMSPLGTIYAIPTIRGYYRPWLARGVYGRNAYWMAFEATFWRRGLWEKSGNIRNDLHDACDYALWISFAKHASLYSLDAAVVAFRMHANQRSKDVNGYREEMLSVRASTFPDKGISLFFRITNDFPHILSSLVPYLYVICFGNQHFQFIRYDKHGKSTLVTSALFE